MALIGKGVYASVYREHRRGAAMAVKSVWVETQNDLRDFRTEVAVLRLAQALQRACHVKIAPDLYGATEPEMPGKHGRTLDIEMELFDCTMHQWLQREPCDVSLATCLANLLVQVAILDQCGVSTNDLFTRNILVRARQAKQADVLTRYAIAADGERVVEGLNAFTIPRGAFDVALSDFGLASGTSLPVSHAQRRSQFTQTRDPHLMRTHPLENRCLSARKAQKTDLLCLCISFNKGLSTRAFQQGRRPAFAQWCAELRRCVGDDSLSTRGAIACLLRHPFIQNALVRDVVPHAIVRVCDIDPLNFEGALQLQPSKSPSKPSKS